MNLPSHVNGLEVVAEEAAPSNLGVRHGKMVYYTKIRKLLLSDDSTVYACAVCGEYTAPTVFQVVAHMRVHGRARAEAKAAAPAVAPAEDAPVVVEQNAPVGEGPDPDGPDPAAVALDGLSLLRADRDRWRERAETAEKALAELGNTEPISAGPVPQRLPAAVVDHARERLRLLGRITRSELRAMTKLDTADLDTLSEILTDEGVAKQVHVSRRPGIGGPSTVTLVWVGGGGSA